MAKGDDTHAVVVKKRGHRGGFTKWRWLIRADIRVDH
jgi:hypothetical protein